MDHLNAEEKQLYNALNPTTQIQFSESIFMKYLKAIQPFIIFVIPLYFLTQTEYDKINWNQAVNMAVSSIIPLFFADLPQFFTNIKKLNWKKTKQVYILEVPEKIFWEQFKYCLASCLLKIEGSIVAFREVIKNKEGIIECCPFIAKNRFGIVAHKNNKIGIQLTCIPGDNFFIQLSGTDEAILLDFCRFVSGVSIKTEKASICNFKNSQTYENSVCPLENAIISENNLVKLKLALKSFQNPETQLKLNNLGLRNKLTIMLDGEKGLGKTTLALAIAKELKRNVYFFDKCKPDLEKVTSLNLSDKVIIFDDIDFLPLQNRTQMSETSGLLVKSLENDNKKAEVSQNSEKKVGANQLLMNFMHLLDAFDVCDNFCFIFTTNHIDKFDPALFRAGRINLTLKLTGLNSEYMYSKLISNIYERKDFAEHFTQLQLENLYNLAFTISEITTHCILPNLDNFLGFILSLKRRLKT